MAKYKVVNLLDLEKNLNKLSKTWKPILLNNNIAILEKKEINENKKPTKKKPGRPAKKRKK